jgi:hypothetical protein
MDPRAIANYIHGLNKTAFDSVVTLVLNSVFKLNAIDVDGAGDGGSDMRIFANQRNHRVLATAIQKTVSSQSWQDKAFEDAQKAVDQLNARVYFFLTSKKHQSGELRRVEQRISTELGIGATCLGATEIAALIHENELELEFAEGIHLPLDVNLRKRPDHKEILLHAFLSLDDDRRHLQNEVYDNALLITLYDLGAAQVPEELIAKARELIGVGVEKDDRLLGRIDSLRSRGRLVSETGATVWLSKKTKTDLDVSTGMYVDELNALSSAQAQLVTDKGGKVWSEEQSRQAAVFLSRLFVQYQLQLAEHASLPLTKTGLSNSLGDPKTELEELLRESGLKGDKIAETLEELVKLGSDLPIIKKLTAAVTHVAAEGRNVAHACRALGAANWDEVIVTVDSSVAIPYLCSSLFLPSTGRFSVGANAGIKALRRLNATLVIQYVYINEIAAHLVSALDAPDEAIFAEASEQSRNGFVSHYFWLRNHGHDVPENIRDFVKAISPKALARYGDRHEHVRRVMPDVQPLLQTYGIEFEHLTTFEYGTNEHKTYKDPVERQFDHYFSSKQKVKSHRLIDHDALVLAYHRKMRSESSESRMCLTWDRSIISVAKELGDCGLIVTPSEAADLVIPTRVDGPRLTSLAHTLAKTQITPSLVGARLLDRVTQIAGARLQDWQFKQAFTELFGRVTDHALEQPNALEWADNALDTFLTQQGVAIEDTTETAPLDGEI